MDAASALASHAEVGGELEPLPMLTTNAADAARPTAAEG
jgi:hypothetical protein